MVSKYKVLWDKCLALIKENVTEQQFKTWFAPIVFESFDASANTLLLQVQSHYAYEYLEQYYVGLLNKVLARCFGANVVLRYRIVTDSEHHLTQDIDAEQPGDIEPPRALHLAIQPVDHIGGIEQDVFGQRGAAAAVADDPEIQLFHVLRPFSAVAYIIDVPGGFVNRILALFFGSQIQR